ncbi:glycoside hydrolase family protein [Ralstonia edaphi]|uniref:glycoside hydrolase family protein n=1 Tax=Ralstonia edaphi TaxID=3058599 RepID=UPI003D1712EC
MRNHSYGYSSPAIPPRIRCVCSLDFNVGDIARIAPGLCRKINSGAYADAAKEFLDITNGGISGLVKRRKQGA